MNTNTSRSSAELTEGGDVPEKPLVMNRVRAVRDDVREELLRALRLQTELVQIFTNAGSSRRTIHAQQNHANELRVWLRELGA